MRKSLRFTKNDTDAKICQENITNESAVSALGFEATTDEQRDHLAEMVRQQITSGETASLFG